LKAIEFAFTGKLTDNADSYVREMGQGEATNGTVTLEFEKDGQTGKIFRQVGKSPKRYFEWDGVRTTKAKDVEDALEEIFGADRQAIGSAVFVSQGELDRFMFGTPSEREQLFTKLMLLNFLEKRSEMVTRKIEILGSGLQDFSMQRDELNTQMTQVSSVYGLKTEELKKNPDRTQNLVDLREWSNTEKQLEKEGREHSSQSARVREKKASLDVILSQLKELLPFLESLSDVNYASTKEARNSLLSAIDVGNSDVKELTSRKSSAERRFETSNKIEELRPIMVKTMENIKSLETRSDVSRWEEIKGHLNAWTDIQQIKEDIRVRELALESDVASIKETPEVADNSSAVDKLEIDIQEHRDTLASDKLNLKLMEACLEYSDGNKCPLCQSVVEMEVSKEALHECRSKITDSELKITTNLVKISELRKEETVVKETRNKLSNSIIQHMENIGNSKAKLKLVSEPSKSREELSTELRDIENTKIELKKESDTYHTCTSEMGKLEGLLESNVEEDSVDSISATLSDAQSKLHDLQMIIERVDNLWNPASMIYKDVTEAQLLCDKAKERVDALMNTQNVTRSKVSDILGSEGVDDKLSQLEESMKIRNELCGEIRETERHINEVKDRKKALDNRMEQDAVTRAVIEQLRILKETLSRGGLPLSYMSYQFDSLIELAQNFLEDMDANFSISATPDKPMSFSFTRVDETSGVILPQDKLSGGQRVRLAIAMLLSVQSLILPDVGLLVLDEPSVHLDTEGVENLKELLLDIGQRLGSTDMQVLVCDHHESLEPAFGAVLRLT